MWQKYSADSAVESGKFLQQSSNTSNKIRHMTFTPEKLCFIHFDNSKSSTVTVNGTRHVVLRVCETPREPSVKEQHPSVTVVKLERRWRGTCLDCCQI